MKKGTQTIIKDVFNRCVYLAHHEHFDPSVSKHFSKKGARVDFISGSLMKETRKALRKKGVKFGSTGSVVSCFNSNLQGMENKPVAISMRGNVLIVESGLRSEGSIVLGKKLDKALESLGEEKGIKGEILLDAVEVAILSAARKKLGSQYDLQARYNPESGEVEVFRWLQVVEKVQNPYREIELEEARKRLDADSKVGDKFGERIETSDFGRISVKEAKKAIAQGVRKHFPSSKKRMGKNLAIMANRIVKDAMKRKSDGGVRCQPSSENADLYKKVGFAEEKISNTFRLQFPAVGGDREKATIGGMPMLSLLAKDGSSTVELAPLSCIESNSGESFKAAVISRLRSLLAAGQPAEFAVGANTYPGPAVACDTFAWDVARQAAATPSTVSSKGLMNTHLHGVKVFISNLSSKDAVGKLVEKHPGLFKNSEKLVEWIGEGGEVDGMWKCGEGVAKRLCISEVFQARLIALKQEDRLKEYRILNKMFQDAVLTNLENALATNSNSDDWRPAVTLAENDVIETAYNDAVKACTGHIKGWTEIEARYSKGVMAATPWLADDVILLDINALKGRDKNTIKGHVSNDGYWEVNPQLLSFLADINSGKMSCGWQIAQYMLPFLPENFPVVHKGRSMSGRWGLGPAQERMVDLIHTSLDHFDTGIVDQTLADILELAIETELKTGEANLASNILASLWNNKLQRKELQSWLMSFCRRNKWMFQTVGMSKVGTILPEKRYALDCNTLPSVHNGDEIVLHDGSVHKAHVVYLSDPRFWRKLSDGQEARVTATTAGMFKHPVSAKRVHDVVILKDPRAYGWGDLKKGLWMHSTVSKLAFVGDTDGDAFGYYPLWTKLKRTEAGKWKLDYTEEDYCVVWTIIKSLANLENETNVEEYQAGCAAQPILPELGAAEKIMKLSGQLVGSASLLVSQLERLSVHYAMDWLTVDPTLDQFYNRKPKKGELEKVKKAMKLKLDAMASFLFFPVRKEASAIMELFIVLAKKDTLGGALMAMNKFLFSVPFSEDPELAREQKIIQRQLVRACMFGEEDANKHRRMVSKAIENKDIRCFAPNDNTEKVWSTAIMKMIRKFTEDCDMRIIQADGSLLPLVYNGDSSSRFADQMPKEDPEFLRFVSVKEEEAWGICQPSNLRDGLANWARTYRILIKKLKARTEALTERKDLWVTKENGEKELNPHEVCNANRCIDNENWRYLIPSISLSERWKERLASMFRAKQIWSTLGMRGSWNTNAVENSRRSDLVGHFKSIFSTKCPSQTFLGWMVLAACNTNQESTESPDAEPISPVLSFLSSHLFKKAFEAGPEDGQRRIAWAKEQAQRFVTALAQRMEKASEHFHLEWVLYNLPQSFRDEFYKILHDAAYVVLASAEKGKLFEDFDEAFEAGAGDIEERLCRGAISAAKTLSTLALPQTGQNNVQFSPWQIGASDYIEVLRKVKEVRKNFKEIVEPYRNFVQSACEENPPELQRYMWHLAYDKQFCTYKKIWVGVLPIVLRKAGLAKNTENELIARPGMNYTFGMWGLDAINKYGIPKESCIMGRAEKGRKKWENPRIPILWNMEYTGRKDQLVPVPMCLGNPITFSNGETNTDLRHAVGLRTVEGEMVAIVCEKLNTMRILLGFDRVRISVNEFEASELKNKKHPMADLGRYWNIEMKELGTWKRHLVRIQAFNHKESDIVTQALGEVLKTRMVSLLRKMDVPQKVSKTQFAFRTEDGTEVRELALYHETKSRGADPMFARHSSLEEPSRLSDIQAKIEHSSNMVDSSTVGHSFARWYLCAPKDKRAGGVPEVQEQPQLTVSKKVIVTDGVRTKK
tara:strand:- start:1747 stop:7176 length:5430 start_codon:yes stop_codon:yes gene_type:complete